MLNDKGDTLQTNGSKAQEVFISVKGIINDTKNTLDTIDEIFTITDKYEFAHSDDSSRELYIGAKNSASKTTTKTKYYETNKLLSDVSTLLNSLQSVTSTTIQNIKTLQDKTKTMLDSLSDTLDIATTSVNSSIVGGSVTQSQISNRSSTLSSANSKVLSQLSSLNNSISSLKTTSTDIENQRSTVRNLETQLQVNKENLQTVLKGAKSEDVQIQLNNLKQMQISLSQLSEQSENYELTAAFDGNIDIVNMKV
ncbi:TPA: hypothetical protein DEP21_02040 [Patescibacteria group bacterium]|nr:hypothetical protein [Candidatus Gracilibacteria bacterium]